MEATLNDYGQIVDYFEKGSVDKDFIREDRLEYFKRWPPRENGLEEELTVIETDQSDINKITFVTKFSVRTNIGKGVYTARNGFQTYQRLWGKAEKTVMTC